MESAFPVPDRVTAAISFPVVDRVTAAIASLGLAMGYACGPGSAAATVAIASPGLAMVEFASPGLAMVEFAFPVVDRVTAAIASPVPVPGGSDPAELVQGATSDRVLAPVLAVPVVRGVLAPVLAVPVVRGGLVALRVRVRGA